MIISQHPTHITLFYVCMILLYIVQILSRDSVTVAVDAVVYYRVQNPTIAVSNVENFR